MNNEFDKLKRLKVTEGCEECLIMTVQRQTFRKLISSVSYGIFLLRQDNCYMGISI